MNILKNQITIIFAIGIFLGGCSGSPNNRNITFNDLDRMNLEGLTDVWQESDLRIKKGDPSGVLYSNCKGFLEGRIYDTKETGIGIALFSSSEAAIEAMEGTRRDVATVIIKGQNPSPFGSPWWHSYKSPSGIIFVCHKNVVVEVVFRQRPYEKVKEELILVAQQVIEKLDLVITENKNKK